MPKLFHLLRVLFRGRSCRIRNNDDTYSKLPPEPEAHVGKGFAAH